MDYVGRQDRLSRLLNLGSRKEGAMYILLFALVFAYAVYRTKFHWRRSVTSSPSSLMVVNKTGITPQKRVKDEGLDFKGTPLVRS
jgi:hypothetical protein